ncbi:MAG: efflux RND transporter periplasmic adaptor subunit, partial [Muribaculaceae bacterium]|nr:efflux RND transporter periplasmic adaptor subunit [Muribaculaceae bacterium]
LVSADDVQMAISVPESEIGAISEGAGAELSFPAIGVRGLEGKVVSRSVVADPLTRAYTVKLSLPADSRGILPGMVGEARLGIGKSGTAQTGVVLPSQAVLLSFDNRNFVWVVSDGKAERRFVTADELASDGVRVTSGLSAGDSVIVAGMQKVGTGTFVFAAE